MSPFYNAISAMIFLCVVILTSKSSNGEKPEKQNLIETKVIAANVSNTLDLILNDTVEYIIQYTTQTEQPLRVFVSSSDAKRDSPVFVVVRQWKEVQSWELPMRIQGPGTQDTYFKSAHTLCKECLPPNVSLSSSSSTAPIVSLSTSSVQNVSIRMHVEVAQDFYIRPNVKYVTSVTPAEPKFYFFDFTGDDFNNTDPLDNTQTVILQVRSPDDVCMVVSIQNSSCPVYDLNYNVKFEGLWETVTRKGGISIAKSKYPHGFYVVFVPKIDDFECTGDDDVDSMNRTKRIEYVILPSISFTDYVNAIMATLVCILLFYIVFGVSFFVCSKRVYVPRTMEYMGANTPTTTTTHATNRANASEFVDDLGGLRGNASAALDAISYDEIEYDAIAETLEDRDIILSKREIFLSDLARKDFRILRNKSYSYLWHVLTVALFYGLPVTQLVITYQRVLNNTGNQDLCYYNFLCAHPLGLLSDFNHFYSNIGYVSFGILFLWIVYRRERWHNDTDFDQQFGIPQHYGMFYAMGVGLTTEGVLSASYHICPNQSNFQFDSSFMYVIAVLSMVKIYQTRHPDINATAYSTFGVLAIAIVLGMWGILAPSLSFWVGVTVAHFLLGFYLTAHIYYLGCWRAGLQRYAHSLITDLWRHPLMTLKPAYTGRFALLLVGNLCNWAYAIYGVVYHQRDFAMHLLGVFMMNTILYFIFYVAMKILHKERINMLAWLFLTISLSCAALAVYCFVNKSISWALTPALSRLYNQDCKVMRFYDYHDLWHFLSAVGMFFMFMVLLLLDDDLSHTHRSQIRVF